MFSRDLHSLEHDRSRESQTHAHYLLLALSRAAQAIQRAHTAEDFYSAVGKEIQSLGGNVALLLLNDDRQSLSIAYLSYAPGLIRKAEQMTGLSLRAYRLPLVPGGIYDRTLQGRASAYAESSIDILNEALPKPIRALSSPLSTIFNLRQSVVASLWVDDEPLGILSVDGAFLNRDDLPAMDSFAGQIATGLSNVRLMQKLQDELVARKQAEEALTHNRNLLLALGRAANQVQLARDPDEIYQVVGEQIHALGFETTILKFGSEKRSLHYQYTSVPEKIIHTAERTVGFKAQDFSWSISEESIYGRVIRERRSEYIVNGKNLFKEALPSYLHPFADKLIELLDTDNGIIAPLYVDDETLGIMLVYGSKRLGPEDLPAVDSFAAQVSVSLRNAALAKRVQDELQERRLAEEALWISQSTFEGIFNSVTETIYIQDENGVFLDVNEGAERMYGYPREYFIGRTPEFLSAPGRNDLVKVAGYVQQAFLGEPAEFEFWGIKKDGTIFPKDVRLTPGTYFGRNVVIAVARDITERRKAEEELRANEAKIQALLDSVPDMIFVMSREGQYLGYHAASDNLLYAPPAAFLGRNIREIMPADFAEEFLSTTDRVLETGKSQFLEYALEIGGQKHDFEAHIVTYLEDCTLCISRDVTERKKIEEAIHQAEGRFRALIENAPDGVSLVGVDGKIKYASPSARSMFGYKGNEYINENPMDYMHPEDVGGILVEIERLIEDPSYVPTLQYRYRHQDGSYRWVESTFSNQFAEPGVEAMVINFRDVTERKEMEKALHESEKYYRALIENAADGILVFNSDRGIEYESPSVFRLLGYGAEKLIRSDALGLIHPDDIDELYEAFRVGLETPGYMHRGEYRLKDGNGEWRYIEIVSQFLLNDLAIGGVIINGRDITDRKRVEEALRESERRFHSIVSESTDGITLTDENGRILEFNNALEKLTGLKRDQVLGRYIWDFQIELIPQNERTEETYRGVKENFQQLLAAGVDSESSTGVEVLIERADKTRRFVQLRKFSVRTDKGWRLGSIAHDITEKKQAEQALRQQVNNLRSLYQMTATLGQSSDLNEVFSTALDSLQSTLSIDRAAVLLFDPDGVMRFKTWRGLSEAYRKIAEGHSPWKADDPDPQPVFVPDARMDPGWSHFAAAFEAEGIGSLGFIPIVYQEKLLGKFMIYYNEMHLYHEEEVQLAQTIARHVAFAISRRQADDALRASEEMYRILYEDNPSMYFTADEKGVTLSVNKYGVSQLGYSPQELIGQPIINIFHPDDRKSVRLQIESCLDNPQRTVQIEARKVDKSGGVRWVRESACAVYDVRGQLVVLVICDDITKRKQAEDELRHANRSLQAAHKELKQMFAHEQVLARTDSLTGLFNRRNFFELAGREFNGSLRYQRPLALILFDIDGFKKANDTFGHAFGDNTLVKISQAAKSQVREVDILARYGGDEFIVLMPETNTEQAFLIAERIRKEVETAIIDAGGVSMSATISLGIADMLPATDRSVEAIISRADKALYTAKQAGRNHAVIYSDG